MIEIMVDSIAMDLKALGISDDDPEAMLKLKKITGFESMYGWNKRCWARAANVFPAIHPQVFVFFLHSKIEKVYTIMVGLFARLNPDWKHPEMVGAQLYETKQKLQLPSENTIRHVDAQPWILLEKENQGAIVPNYIQGWIPLQDIEGALQIKLASGFHKTWRERCRQVPIQLRPQMGSKATDVFQYIKELELELVDITNDVKPGDLVIFHTMTPHSFTQLKSGIRRDTYVQYDWFLDGEFQGNNSSER